MQEPSLQVKSIEGHGAKSTGAPPAKTDTAWYSWSTTAVSSSFVPRFSARADNVEARAEVVMMVYMWFAHVFVYIYIYSNVNTRMYTKHARGSTTWTRDARVERTHLKRGGHIGVYIHIESICYTAENGTYFYYMGGDCQTAILDHDFTSSYC